MAEILFVTWDGGGNVPPALGIAAELAARGHTIRFVGHPSQRSSLEAAGVEVAPTRRAAEFSALDQNSPFALVAMFGDRGLGRDVLDALAGRPADVVVVDCFLFGVMAELTDEPAVPTSSSSTCTTPTSPAGWMKGPMGLGMRLKRLQPTRALAAAQLRLVASVPSLDPAGDRPGLTYVGPVAPVSAPVATEPMVLVSLSTYRFPRMAAVPADDPGRLRRSRRTRRRDHRTGRRPGGAARPGQRRGASVRAARRADAPRLDDDRARRARHHDAGARPRPADGADADAPDARPADGRPIGRGGGCRARRTEEGDGRAAARP